MALNGLDAPHTKARGQVAAAKMKSHLWTVLAASCNVIFGFGSSGLLRGLNIRPL